MIFIAAADPIPQRLDFVCKMRACSISQQLFAV